MRPGTTITRLALAVAASAAWVLTPSTLSGQAGDSTTVKARLRSGAARSAARACCLVVRLDGASGIVTARETATGYTFRFEVKDRRRRAALKVGDPVWADFGSRTVKLRSTDASPCCAIVTTPPAGGFESSGAGGALPPARIPDPRI